MGLRERAWTQLAPACCPGLLRSPTAPPTTQPGCLKASPLNPEPSLAGRECERDEELVRLVPCMKSAGPTAASLLIECRGRTPEILQVREGIRHTISGRA